MIKNKKALIGKIFLFLGILILIILAIAGITIWQVYDIVKTAYCQTNYIDNVYKRNNSRHRSNKKRHD